MGCHSATPPPLPIPASSSPSAPHRHLARTTDLADAVRVLSRGRGRALAYRSAARASRSAPCDAAGQRLARNPLPRATRTALAAPVACPLRVPPHFKERKPELTMRKE